MGIIARLLKKVFRLMPPPPPGAGFQDQNPWCVAPTRDAARFLRALPFLFPTEAVACFEGTARRFGNWVQWHALDEPLKIAPGTIWPKTIMYHVPLTVQLMTEAADLIEREGLAPAVHVYVHDRRHVLLWWPDAFCDDPIWVDSSISEQRVTAFALALGHDAVSRTSLTFET